MSESKPLSSDYLTSLRQKALDEIEQIHDEQSAEAFRIRYLGKKGEIRNCFKRMKDVPAAQRKEIGRQINTVQADVETAFEQATRSVQQKASARDIYDHTLPGYRFPRGSLHPLAQIRNRMRDIFISMGFSIAYGPEVETEFHNFEALNFPKDHPARDMQDTFYVTDTTVLRTHTSPVQVRVMLQEKPPIRSIMPGRVYREEEISARSYCTFHQVEGLYVDTNVSFADLKGTLLGFVKAFFGPDSQIKIRPSFFPFTEPSIEVDVECFLCNGRGCRVCKHTGWLEVLGAGMVHPNVFAHAGVDPEIYTGFAFGIGIDRIAMLLYGIDDIRLFFENDVRFLRQF
jgi:phenylalanyl-tRNA synthetase alpha chain